jgi:hypothetical protein
MSDEEQIQKALNTLALMREVAGLTKTQKEADEAARIIAETESWVMVSVWMLGKSISGDKLQAVLDDNSVILLPVVKEASTEVASQ